MANKKQKAETKRSKSKSSSRSASILTDSFGGGIDRRNPDGSEPVVRYNGIELTPNMLMVFDRFPFISDYMALPADIRVMAYRRAREEVISALQNFDGLATLGSAAQSDVAFFEHHTSQRTAAYTHKKLGARVRVLDSKISYEMSLAHLHWRIQAVVFYQGRLIEAGHIVAHPHPNLPYHWQQMNAELMRAALGK